MKLLNRINLFIYFLESLRKKFNFMLLLLSFSLIITWFSTNYTNYVDLKESEVFQVSSVKDDIYDVLGDNLLTDVLFFGPFDMLVFYFDTTISDYLNFLSDGLGLVKEYKDKELIDEYNLNLSALKDSYIEKYQEVPEEYNYLTKLVTSSSSEETSKYLWDDFATEIQHLYFYFGAYVVVLLFLIRMLMDKIIFPILNFMLKKLIKHRRRKYNE